MLSYISPDLELSRWIRIGLILWDEFGEASRDVFESWSRGSDRFNQSEFNSHWRSFARTVATGKAAGIGTLVFEAKQYGWRPAAAQSSRRASSADMARIEADREARKAAAAVEAERGYAVAADAARRRWDAALPAETHPYAERKLIGVQGLRVADVWQADIIDHDTGEVLKQRRVRNALLVPIWSGPGRLSSLQAIFPDAKNALGRDRDYMAGGRKQGCYTTIGHIGRDTHIICIGEGYATCYSAHEASGWPVMVAFDAGNLLAVAKMARAKLGGGVRIVILADDDRWHADGKNPGMEAARRAAAEVAGFVAAPVFASLDGEPTDFNDLRLAQGVDAVRACLEASLAPPPAPEPAPWDGDDEVSDAAPAPESAPSPAPAQAEADIEHNGYFSVLGYDHDQYYFFQHERRQISKYTKGDFSKNGLIELAPLNWWECYFPGKQGMDATAAADWLIRVAGRKGIYDISRVRGRGAWADDGRIVYHHGGSLTVDGRGMDVTQIRSRYVYEQAASLLDPAETAMGSDEGEMLLDLAAMFRWTKPASAVLMAGWVALAPVCGALPWRSHIWLSGGPGTGKSWILNQYIHHLLKGVDIFAQGNSSEAGIRQRLRADARPVLFDESEQNTERERDRMASVIALIRQSSTDSDAETLKGTANGDAMAFHIRSAFCLASIQVGLSNKADTDRIAVLSLRPKHDDTDAAGNFDRLKRAMMHMQSDSTLPARLFRRSIDLLPVTLKNRDVFVRVAADIFGSVRDGDQLGTLLAGAWSLQSTEIVSADEAREWISRHDWSDVREDSDRDTSEDALAALMERRVRATSSTEATVYELVREAAGFGGLGIGKDVSCAVLARHGLLVKGDWLCVSNNGQAVRELMRGTPYEQDMRGLLSRIKGADRNGNKGVWISGSTHKVVRIPLEKVMPDGGEAPF